MSLGCECSADGSFGEIINGIWTGMGTRMLQLHSLTRGYWSRRECRGAHASRCLTRLGRSTSFTRRTFIQLGTGSAWEQEVVCMQRHVLDYCMVGTALQSWVGGATGGEVEGK